MSISTTKHHNIGLSERQQQEIITNKFEMFGETYTFVETLFYVYLILTI